MFILILFRKKRDETEEEGAGILNKNIQNITRTIEEFSDEQREIVKKFKAALEKFTSERTLESCLDVLNLSMQLSNIREKLLESYKQYSIFLEIELKKSIEQKKSKNQE